MEEGEGMRLSKRFTDKGGEVDLNTKAGTAWSHNFLNQKPWHPLSYPNQRRKWIAEQTHIQHQRRSDEVAREFAQEQEFFRQTALVSQKEKEKMEMMKAVSFMYVRPPGYNAESAKAAELAEERRKEEEGNDVQDGPSSSMPPPPSRDQSREDKKKSVPKDVFGRALPTAEQFEVLKNAPRLETGAPARPKPFAVEIRNVKCLRCGKFGHQSGDRECPLKDAIMPNEENRLQRDDPLTAMMAHAESSEPLRWELKQKPGMSPPRGGFDPDDPNQQIVAEDIFDEYGGFLGGEIMPDLLANFTSSKPKKKSKSKKKHQRQSLPSNSKYWEHGSSGDDDDDDEDREPKKKSKSKKKHQRQSSPCNSKYWDFEKHGSSSDNDEDRKRSRKRRRESGKGKHLESCSSDHGDKVEKKYAHVDDDDDLKQLSRSRSRLKKKNDIKAKHEDFEPRSWNHKEKSGKKEADDYGRTVSRSEKRNDNKTKHRYSGPDYTLGEGELNKSRKERRERHTHSYSPKDLRGDLPKSRKESRHRRSYSPHDSRGELPNGRESWYHEEDGSFGNDDKQKRSKQRQHSSRKTEEAKLSLLDENKLRRNEVCEDENKSTRSRSKKGDDTHNRNSRRVRSYSSDDSAFDECRRSKHDQSLYNQ